MDHSAVSAAAPLPPAFRKLALSNLAAQTAEQIALATAPLVAVLVFHAGEGATGLLLAMQTLPFLLLCLPAGVLADRLSRRRLLLVGEAARLAALLCTLGLFFTDALSLPWLAALGFVGATGTVVFSVAAPALVPALVDRHWLPAANSRIELTRSLAFAAGPALGGAIAGSAGAMAAFALASALSALALFCLRDIAEPPRAAVPARKPVEELVEGLSFVVRHALLRPVLVTAIFFNIGFFTIQAVYVPYAIAHLGLGASGVGATMAVLGFGMIAAALVGQRVMARWPLGVVIAIGPLSGLAASLLMLATVRWPTPWLAAASFLFIGAGPVLWVIASTTLRQAVTPARLIGRASAVVVTATWGARPIGALIGAGVGSVAGAPWCLAVAVVAFAVQAAVVLASPLVRLRDLPAAAPVPA